VNTTLLDKLSADNGGASDYIEPHENLEVKVSNFFAKVNYPVLSGLSLDMGKVKTDLMYPKTLPDLFKGSQITLIGRYSNSESNAVIKLNGTVQGRAETFTFEGKDFQAETRANDFLPRLWATRRVGYLLEQIRLNGENKELVDEVISLGTRYGIVTPYTSFLITEPGGENAVVRPMGRRGDAMTAVTLKAMKEGSGAAGSAYGGPAGSPGAVSLSRAERDMRESEVVSIPLEDVTRIRTAGDRTFRMKDGVWIDTDYTETGNLPVVEVVFGSDEFYDLIAKSPKLAEYFSLGEKIVVVFEGKVYRVR
ncbi:MAG TPA: trypsin, partial [Blastocatellia bacterium]|nr:trypsin [Blastocatellia bacterium]